MIIRFFRALLGVMLTLAWVNLAQAQSTINTAMPASSTDLTSLVVRQQFLAAANDINGLLSKHAATSVGQCPPSPFVGTDCLTIGSTPYGLNIWTGGTAGWTQWATINPTTGVVAIALNSGEIAGSNPVLVTFPAGVATVALNYDANFTNNGSNQLAFSPIAAGNLLANCTSGAAEPMLQTWSACMDRNIGSTNGMLPLRAGGVWGNVALGASVGQPGTGTLENLLPVQTNFSNGAACTTSCAFASSDFFRKTRRSNSGTAMTDTLPAAGTAGLVNGTRIVIANADATATDTVTAGSGTVMASGGSTDTIGPGRDVAYEYDLANTQWRGGYNTRTALLGPNNLSDLSSAAAARTNLGLGTLATVIGGTGVTAALANALNATGGLVGFSGTLGSPSATAITIGAGGAITSSGPGGALGSNAYSSTAYLPLGGGTMSGSIAMGGNAISGLSTLSMSGQLTSTLAPGTAPFSVASTTNVANLNASSLNGATFASPGPIGSSTASTGAFTTLSSAAHTITATSVNAIAIGQTGGVNPGFTVNTVTGVGTGVSILTNNAGSGAVLAAISSGTNENLTINAKGSGTIGIGSGSTGAVTVTPPFVISAGMTAAALATPSSNIAGSLCQTSAGVFLYVVSVNCFGAGAATSLAPLTTTVSPGTNGNLLAVTTGGCTSGSPCLGQITLGSVGQHLGVTGTAPTFKSGGWELLNTTSGSTVSSLSDTTSFGLGYSEYEIVIEGLFCSSATTASIQYEVSGTPVTTGYIANTLRGNGSAATSATFTTGVPVTDIGACATAAPGAYSKTFTFSPASSITHQFITEMVNFASANTQVIYQSANAPSAAVMSGFTVVPLTGTITVTAMKTYGRL